MIAVSDAYKTESRQVVRNQSFMRITYSVIEPDADNLAEPQDNGRTYFSDLAAAVLDTEKTVEPIVTLERNRWYLDGSQTPIPDNEPYGYAGYVGSELSGDDCVYADPPTIRIDFSDYFSFAGLTFSFDTTTSDYPSEIRVDGYKDGSQTFSKTYNPDSPVWPLGDSIPEDNTDFVNRVDIVYLKSSKPLRRARMEQLIFGIIYTFENPDIQSASWRRKLSPISTELPTEGFQWSIIDEEKNFDPENAAGVYSYLDSRQHVSVEIGYELNDGSIEWLPVGEMLSTSSFSTEGIPTIASFEADSTLLSLTQTYNEGKYASGGTTLYDAAKAMLDFSWQVSPKYVLSEKLKNYKTKVPMPVDDVRNNLQLIANAAMCQLYTDRDGVVHIDEISAADTGFGLTFHDLMEAPKVTKVPVLYSVTTSYKDVSVGSSTEELLKTDVSYASATLVEFSYDTSTEQTLTAGSGITVTGAVEYFANMCRCTISGTGVITVTGKRIEENDNIVQKIYDVSGEDCPVENPLITDRTWALEYCDWIAAYEKRRNQYEVTDRGYPEIDMGDVIDVDTSFTDALKVTVVSHNINFSGAINGTSEYLIGGA